MLAGRQQRAAPEDRQFHHLPSMLPRSTLVGITTAVAIAVTVLCYRVVRVTRGVVLEREEFAWGEVAVREVPKLDGLFDFLTAFVNGDAVNQRYQIEAGSGSLKPATWRYYFPDESLYSARIEKQNELGNKFSVFFGRGLRVDCAVNVGGESHSSVDALWSEEWVKRDCSPR